MNTLASLNLSAPQYIAGFFVGIFILGVLSLLWHKSKEEKEHTKLAENLWQTGATRLLAQVWRLTGDAHHHPTFLGAESMSQDELIQRVWPNSVTEKHFTGTVCGENVRASFHYPNTLFCQVENETTKQAIIDAHNLMAYGERYQGTFSLKLEIHISST